MQRAVEPYGPLLHAGGHGGREAYNQALPTGRPLKPNTPFRIFILGSASEGRACKRRKVDALLLIERHHISGRISRHSMTPALRAPQRLLEAHNSPL